MSSLCARSANNISSSSVYCESKPSSFSWHDSPCSTMSISRTTESSQLVVSDELVILDSVSSRDVDSAAKPRPLTLAHSASGYKSACTRSAFPPLEQNSAMGTSLPSAISASSSSVMICVRVLSMTRPVPLEHLHVHLTNAAEEQQRTHSW